MTALKGRDIGAFLNNPDISNGYILVYGPDGGLVSENTALLAKRFAGDPPDPETLVSLQMSEIEADPQRLGIAARTPSLFGSGRVIRIRGANGKLAATLTELLDEGVDAVLLIEAGDLKPADALRRLAESRRDARALPCYADNARDLDALIRTTFQDAGIRTDPDLVPFLRDLLGNDRQVTRGELTKLLLYAQESKVLTREDVEALCGDNAALAIDSVVDAIGTGHTAKFDEAVTRALAGGTDMQRLLVVTQQHMSRLRAMRAEMDAGASTETVIARATPRVHFSRKGSMEQQLRLWTDTSLAAACARLHKAVGDSRKHPALSAALARQAMLAVCMAAARR